MRKPCCEEEHLSKRAWSKQEDEKLIDYIRAHGEICWRSLPKEAGLLRCGKSCRRRWINYLKPSIDRRGFSEDEEDLIMKLHALLGNRWSLIAGRLPGRTDNEVKNYWKSCLGRKVRNTGLDLNHHRWALRNRLLGKLNHGAWSSSSWVTQVPAGSPCAQRCNGCAPTSYSRVGDDDQTTWDEASSIRAPAHFLPDLNVDLNVRSPSFLFSAGGLEEEHCHGVEEDTEEASGESSPTLLLFR